MDPLGGADPAAFAAVRSVDDMAQAVAEQPSNHSPFYAPVIEPTLAVGLAALVEAARIWLPRLS